MMGGGGGGVAASILIMSLGPIACPQGNWRESEHCCMYI